MSIRLSGLDRLASSGVSNKGFRSVVLGAIGVIFFNYAPVGPILIG